MIKLFPKADAMLHGGDYNPEQWLDRPDILEEDIKLMKEAHVNVVTLGVFSWSVYEPVEGEYHFDWLEEIMNNLYENGIYTILATPSGARPAWLDYKYPTSMRTNSKGERNLHGERHNQCMTSLNYRAKVKQIDTKLAERFGHHPGLIAWHISNEMGSECWCASCRVKFQNFLRKRYNNDIEQLNKAWWTTFWSHRFNNFEQIDPPSGRGEKSIHGLNLDWKRFNTENTISFMKEEIDVVKHYSPDLPVTTNFMHLYPALDYNKMSKELDIISWDSYPRYNTPDESLFDTFVGDTFDNIMLRSMKKDRPFMLMESVPSLVNWHEFNKAKRPKVHMLTSMHTIACGSDTIQYFQWRKGRGSYEQYHGAVIDHLGRSDTRVFKDVKEVGEALEKLQEIQGALVKSKAAIIYDQENRWAIEDAAAFGKKSKKYPETCMAWLKVFMKNGVDVDIISSEEDYSDYKLIVAPQLYLLKDGVADRLKKFVSDGGTLVSTYMTGYVDKSTLCFLGGFPGDSLTELFGLYSEEIDTLYPKDKNGIKFNDSFIEGEFAAKDYCDILKVQTAEVLAEYTADFYEGTPAVTVNNYGKGKAYYVGARVEEAAVDAIVTALLDEQNIEHEKLPDSVEYHCRQLDNTYYDFFMNCSNEKVKVNLKGEGINMLDGSKTSLTEQIEPLGVLVVKRTV